MRIGLLGGTFNPPHLGHLAVAKTGLWSGEIDAVWFLPCWEHAFGKKPESFNHRASMCQLMIQEEKDIFLCTDEADIKSSCSVCILRELQERNPDNSFRRHFIFIHDFLLNSSLLSTVKTISVVTPCERSQEITHK